LVVWKRFLCGGRLVFGLDASSNVLTGALIGPPLPVKAMVVGVFVSL
jgi:hypothetical protein